jgi:hypothetical protein
MRVVTTWMYFDSPDVKFERPRSRPRGRGEEPDPGVGVAWFGGDTTTLGDIDNLKVFRRLPGPRHEESLTEQLLTDSLDLFLADAEEFEFTRPERSLKNASVVNYLLTQPIVIERSPPLHVSLKGLLTSTNLPVWIGTYMGWAIAPEHSVLLFITIPGGIIVVSSAAGLAEALAAGLSKSVKRLFKAK